MVDVMCIYNFMATMLVFMTSLIGVYLYRILSVRITIIAIPNRRSLHESPMPTSGGVIFAIVFIICLTILWWLNKLSDDLFFVLGMGSTVAVSFGFLDDMFEIGVKLKLIGQFILSCWVLFWFYDGLLISVGWLPSLIAIPITLLFLVWIINAYNFMDGIDGMAVSGAVFVSATMIWVLLWTRPESEFIMVLVLLLASSSAFMLFNWPPASIFMGDAGSVFLGYLFGSLILVTVMVGDVTIWTWLVVLGYFFADTSVTQIMRVILVKKWYLAHRSHAYQNLARITGSHLKVTSGVVLYNLIWILPLTFWSALSPETSLYAVVLAVFPGILVAYRYGPRLSSS